MSDELGTPEEELLKHISSEVHGGWSDEFQVDETYADVASNAVEIAGEYNGYRFEARILLDFISVDDYRDEDWYDEEEDEDE